MVLTFSVFLCFLWLQLFVVSELINKSPNLTPCPLRFFPCVIVFLNQTAGRRTVTLTADRTVIPPGGRVTLTCSVEGPDGFRYDWSRDSKDSPGETFPFVYESDIVISQGGNYTCRGWSIEPYVTTPDINAVFIEETGEFSIF